MYFVCVYVRVCAAVPWEVRTLCGSQFSHLVGPDLQLQLSAEAHLSLEPLDGPRLAVFSSDMLKQEHHRAFSQVSSSTSSMPYHWVGVLLSRMSCR